MKKYKINMGVYMLCALALIIGYACSDEWDKHYDADPGIVSDQTLWDNINSNPELTEFAAILNRVGYDEKLAANQAFTVWAPKNGTFDISGMDDETLITEFVENHIARYTATASGTNTRSIRMLNAKVNDFYHSGGSFYFNTVELTAPNTLCKNGILHVINGRVPFLDNIWEYLSKDSRLDSISYYLHSFDTLIFYPEMSVSGGLDEEGNIIYLDSVFYNANDWLYYFDYINSEDSTFKMILPSNEAWKEAYSRIKDYYVYDGSEKNKDFLQDYYTKYTIVKDLVFNDNTQVSPADSLISTWGNVFYKPQYLFNGAEEKTASNGMMYITDELKQQPLDSWHFPIQVEAESANGRTMLNCNVYTRSAYNSTITGVSRNAYIEAIPTSNSVNPQVKFSMPNTLSAAYDIYCVFATPRITNPNAAVKPNRVRFELEYKSLSGYSDTEYFDNEDFYPLSNDPNKMDTVLVRKNFKFPVANVGLENINVTLNVRSVVTNNQTSTHSRTLLIDCVIFEPAQ